MSSLLIKNGVVVTERGPVQADVRVEGEKIVAVGSGITESADRVIDGTGCYVLPGGVDPHVHLDLPMGDFSSSDSFESGTIAALHGGTTTIIDFANQTRGKPIAEAIAYWNSKAKGKALCDYGFHVSVTDLNTRTVTEIQECVQKLGITSFKTFTAYKDSLMINDRHMLEIMDWVGRLGGIVMVHAENGDMIEALRDRARRAGRMGPKSHAETRPRISEAEATARVIDIAHLVKCPVYIVHMSTGDALDRVRYIGETRSGLERTPVFVETCPQYLLLDEALYDAPGFEGAKAVMSPPLRSDEDRAALWVGIEEGLVDVVATDHCPFTMAQKERGRDDFTRIPNGGPGIEHRLELLYSEGVAKGRMPVEKFVSLVATTPARIFGLYPRKGVIAVGADADLVLFDPHAQHTLSASTHHMNVDYSLYEGMQVQGRVRMTILRGTVAVEEGQLKVGPGFGRYLPRGRSAAMRKYSV